MFSKRFYTTCFDPVFPFNEFERKWFEMYEKNVREIERIRHEKRDVDRRSNKEARRSQKIARCEEGGKDSSFQTQEGGAF